MRISQTVCSWLKVSGFLAVLALSVPAKAEIVELLNGDRYSGEVVRMDKTHIEFISEVQGPIKIPREKVAAILFHPAARSAAAPVRERAGADLKEVPTAKQLQDVMAKIRREGIDEKAMNQVQEQMLAGAGPEANRMFRELAGGLLSGKLNLGDIRAQAEQAVGQIEELRGEFDDETGMLLDGYLSILNSFLQKTAPEKADQ